MEKKRGGGTARPHTRLAVSVVRPSGSRPHQWWTVPTADGAPRPPAATLLYTGEQSDPQALARRCTHGVR